MTPPSSAPVRRRVAAAGAVLGLVAASVVGGVAISASAAIPNAPSILSPVAGTKTASNSITLSGAIDPQGLALTVHVVVTKGGVDDEFCADSDVVYTTTTWECTSTLSLYGNYQFRAYAEDGTGDSPSLDSNVVDVAYYNSDATVSIDSPTDGSLVTASPATVRGTGPALGSVTVFDSDENTLCSSVVSDAGSWSCAPSPAFTAGKQMAYASASTLVGGEPGLDSATFVVEAPPATPTITSPSNGTSTTNTQLTLTGTSSDDTSRPRSVRVTISDGESTYPFCPTVQLAVGKTDWDCSGSFPTDEGGFAYRGTYTFTVTVSFADYGTRYAPLTYPDGTNSSAPAQIQVYFANLPAPDVSYSLYPGGVTATASGVPDSGQSIEVYEVSGSAGNYDWTLSKQCPDEGYGSTVQTCPVSLAPGTWNFSSDQRVGPARSFYRDDYVRIPATPAIGAALSDGGVVLSGTGTPGDLVIVQTTSGTYACSAIVDGSSAWSCTDTPDAGLRSYHATAQSRGFVAQPGEGWEGESLQGFSAWSEIVSIQVPATITPTPTPSPTATKPPLTWTLVMTGINGPLKPGQWVGLRSSGLPAGSEISAELHSTPIALGSTTVRSDGTFNFRVQIPMKVEPGDHHIVVTLTAPGEDPSVVENAVQIELDERGTPPRDGEDIHAGFALAGGAGIDRNDPDSPTAITGSVPTVFDILTSPGTIGIAAGLAIVIMLLVALPTEVLNATIESNTGRFGRGFNAIQSAINRATEWFIRVTRTPLIASVILLVVTSFIFGFVDPHFGFDLASLRLVLSLSLALFVITFVASSLTGVVVRRRWSLESEIGMEPAALIFALLGVVVARLLDFSPGFLVGLVIGLELAHRATDHQRVRAIIVEFSFIVGFGIAAWLAYSTWVALQGGADLGFWGGLLQDALVSITSEGLTAVTVAMIPVAFLDGKKIFESSKRLWVLMFLVAATAFSLLVLPTALAGQQISNVATWVAVLAGFAVVALGLTVWLRRTGRSIPTEANEKVDA
jgi:hypothetical protein